MLSVKWLGVIEGSLSITSKDNIEFEDPRKLISFIRDNKSDFSEDGLRVVGILILFMSIRELRGDKGPDIFSSIEKGINSFGTSSSAINEGINDLVLKLSPVRSEDGKVLMVNTYNHIASELDSLGWIESLA